MSRISVFGGTGYAGGNVVAEAARRGHSVTSISRSVPEHGTDGVQYVAGSLLDPDTRAKALADAELEDLLHGSDGPLHPEVFAEIHPTHAFVADGSSLTQRWSSDRVWRRPVSASAGGRPRWRRRGAAPRSGRQGRSLRGIAATSCGVSFRNERAMSGSWKP